MELQKELLEAIRDYADFPKQGIIFKDICPVLANPKLFKRVVRVLAEKAYAAKAEQIVGVESRGFILGVPVALELGVPFAPARKKGKLPGAVVTESYSLEYGVDHIELQKDIVTANKRTLILDDVIATGGTAAAVGNLIHKNGGTLAGYLFLLELSFLQGRDVLLKNAPKATVDSILVL